MALRWPRPVVLVEADPTGGSGMLANPRIGVSGHAGAVHVVIIADTNVVSEFMKDKPDPTVLGWAQGLDAVDLTISVVTVEEIERGLGRLPDGKRRRNLEQR